MSPTTRKKLAHDMATLSLRLDRRRAKARGLYPIQFLLSHKSSVTTIGTGIAIRPEHWNGQINKAVVPKCPNARAINLILEELYFKYSNALRKLEINDQIAGKGVTEIRRMLLGPQTKEPRELMTDYFRRFAATRRTDSSQASYLYTLKVLREFGGNDIPFDTVDAGWLKALDTHLAEQHLSVNTRAIHFRNIRAVINGAIDEKLLGLDAYPFRKFKIATAHKEKEALSREQLLRVMAYSTPNPLLQVARDMFMLSFYLCGMNLIDLFLLERLHNGRAHFVRTKTAGRNPSPVSLLVQPEAAAIIARYAGQEHVLRFAEEHMAYSTFLNRIQKAMRAIAAELGIEAMTFYTARHTWATMADRIGISEKEITKALGHADRSIAARYYIAYDWTKVDRANRQVIDYLLEKESPNR